MNEDIKTKKWSFNAIFGGIDNVIELANRDKEYV
jgi:hypothetical protein